MKKIIKTILETRSKLPKDGRKRRPKNPKKPRPPNPDTLAGNAGKVGRPTAYTRALGDKICEVIATTAKPLDQICSENEGFPTPAMLYRWLRQYQEFRESYRAARIDQSTVLADQILELADTERLGKMMIQKEDGTRYVRVGDMIGRTKVQIAARQWLLARLDPKKWGAKLEVTDNTNPLKSLAEGWEKRYRDITNGESVAEIPDTESPAPAGSG
jgi:hypothetical protein